MLGLHFSTNLKDIPHINFTETLQKIKKEMGNWKSRLLTPFGRITLIKTLFLPKLIHLFMSLPVPNALLKEINSLMYEFLWDSKPDKVKRKTICAEYSNGGLRMTDIFNFEKALKLSWIRKIVQQTNSHWKSLLIDNGYNINSIPIMGGSYPFYSRLQENKFWNKVFDYWKNFCEKQQPTSNIHILNSCLWYNFQLSNGSIITHTEMCKMYNLAISVFDYHRVKLMIKSFINKYKTNNIFTMSRPFLPFHVRTIFQSPSGSKDFYKIFMQYEADEPICKEIWSKNINFYINDEIWQNIFKACIKSVIDNDLVWFQYKILFNILDTNEYLYKIKISNSNLCRLCGECPETILHLFAQCKEVQDLWQNLNSWIRNKLSIHIDFLDSRKILGYEDYDTHFWPQKRLESKFKEQKTLAIINQTEIRFNKRWEVWQNLFT